MFIKTGWPTPNAPVTPGALFPVSGGYFDEFWSGDAVNSTAGFLFSAITQGSGAQPIVTAESGPGMASSYHRRIHVDPVVAAAAIQVFLANGVTQLGMYMYAGGTDPHGQLFPMQELQAVGEGGANDMPCRTYDFHAPLGEAGQPRGHFHGIRRLSLTAHASQHWLAAASTFLPALTPGGATDAATLRWAARSDGERALLFITTLQPFVAMAPQPGLRLRVNLTGGAVDIPAAGSPPLDLPAGVAPLWAARVPTAGAAQLEYATAAWLGAVDDGAGGALCAWAAAPGVRAELAFNASSLSSWACAPPATCAVEAGLLVVRGVAPAAPPALAPQVALVDAAGGRAAHLVLDAATGDRAWRAPVAGVDTLMLSDANTTFVTTGGPAAPAALTVVSEGLGAPARLWLCPPPAALALASAPAAPLPPAARAGAFAAYDVPLPARGVTAAATPVSPAAPPRVIPRGPSGRAESPDRNCSFADFAGAAVWAVAFSGAPAAGVDVRLRISYNGDAARVYTAASAHARADLVADHFFNGHDLDVPVTRALGAVPAALELRVLPQGPRDVGAPIYFEVPPTSGAALLSVDTVETASVGLIASR
jgi:hypothetical protein